MHGQQCIIQQKHEQKQLRKVLVQSQKANSTDFSPLIHNMTGPLFSSFQDIKQVVMHHAAQTAPPTPSQHTDPQSSSTAAAAHYK